MEKYRSVIHAKTGNNITAFILENDATWVGREKEIFYATPLYCEKDQKIKMIFVKTYRKKNNTVVSAYFRKKKGEQNLRTNISGESDEHKIAKQNIYEGIYSGKISEEFNNKINKQIDEWFSRIPLKNISKELVDRCLPKKICPICGKNMGIGTTINNDSNWYCEKFPYCSGMIKGFDK